MPCLWMGHLLSFHHCSKRVQRRDLTQAPTESLIWWPWCSQQTLDFLKSVLFDRNSNFSLFFQPKQPLWAHEHTHLQMYASTFLWLTWVWEYSKVQILWSNAIALCLCSCSLCSHYQIRDHTLQGSAELISREGKTLLGIRTTHNPNIVSLLPQPCYKWFKAGCEWET